MLLLQFKILLPEGVDTINHSLDELDLRVAKTVLVGNVVGVAGLTARLAAGTTGLESEGFAPLLQLVNRILGPAGQVNVDGGAHASAQVGGAGVDVSELGREQEVLAALSLDGVSDSLDAPGKTLKDTLDVSTLLHGNDTELILLVDPDQEGLVSVVEDTTALGPVALHTGYLQVGVTRHEKEVVVDELLAGLLVHAGQGVVGTSQVTRQFGEGVLHQSLNIDTLLLGDTGGKTETLDAATNTDPGGVDGNIGLNVASDLGRVHVGCVLEVGSKTMVLADEGVEDFSEVNIGVLISSVDAAVLVVELNCAGNSLGQGELRGLGNNLVELVPFLFSHVLGNQGVLGLDFGERSHGLCLINNLRKEDCPAQS